jgi:signal transduction histidine kinase
MNPLRPQLSGLIFKLTLFYVLLSLPSLVLVETGILVYEFNDFMAGVESGSLTHATQDGAAALAHTWPHEADATPYLAIWAEALVLRLQRPHGGLLANDSYILTELGTDPLTAAVLGADGRVLALAPAAAAERLRVPAPDSVEWRALGAGQLLNVADSPYRVRRALAPIRAGDGTLRGYLLVELSLPVPWHRFLLDLSLEWPIVLGYLLVFGIASSLFLATWVTRRLNRVARAATAWSRGDFSDRIGDTSRDELGNLSALLDSMALELKDLMRSRAQLATLAERQRLARDLHDTVKQKAFALSMQLAAARRQLDTLPGGALVAQAENLSRQIQQELAQILDELHASDNAMPLVARLRTRAQEWAQLCGLRLDLDLRELPALPAQHEETLLRIVDEALANVLRHSGASGASISLRHDERGAELTIVDNGRGAGDDARPGMGLANMRERAESLPAGAFEFRSSADGTRVGVRFTITENRST